MSIKSSSHTKKLMIRMCPSTEAYLKTTIGIQKEIFKILSRYITTVLIMLVIKCLCVLTPRYVLTEIIKYVFFLRCISKSILTSRNWSCALAITSSAGNLKLLMKYWLKYKTHFKRLRLFF